MPGAAALDAPVFVDGKAEWFLGCLDGSEFKVIVLKPEGQLQITPFPRGTEGEKIVASHEWLTRYDAQPGSTYLFRPDQHICARWRSYDEQAVLAAVARACGKTKQA